MRIEMQHVGKDGMSPISFEVRDLVIGGWAGRDAEKQEHHIRELEALGVARPKETPTFYRVAAARLTTAPEIEATGTASSGEVETVIFAHDGRLFVGVGSDHTDREAEAVGVTLSKQMCDKPVGGSVWPLDEVEGHWDEMMLRSWRWSGGKRVLYQEGSVAGLLHPHDLIARYTGGAPLADGTALFGGTMPAIGGIRGAERFEAELQDPVLGRSLTLSYAIRCLPVVEKPDAG